MKTNHGIFPLLFLTTLFCLVTANIFLVLHGPEALLRAAALLPAGVASLSQDISSAEWLGEVDFKPVAFAVAALAAAALAGLFFRRISRLAHARSGGVARSAKARELVVLDRHAIARPDRPLLRRRLVLGSGAILLLLAGSVIGWVHYSVAKFARHQPLGEGRALAVALAEAVAPHVLENNPARARAILLKQAIRKDLAYLLIVDNQENLWTDTGKRPEIAAALARVRFDDSGQRVVPFEGATVYDLRAPILEGQGGMVHVGVHQDRLNAESQRLVWTITFAVVAALWVVFAAAYLLMVCISRPLERLSLQVWKVSEGCLNRPISTDLPGALGNLATKCEELRQELGSSLHRLENREKRRA